MDRNLELYLKCDVWERLHDGVVVRYRCLQSIATGMYGVQSADFFQPPFQKNEMAGSDAQFLELLSEELPESRVDFFPSIEEAILHHKNEFSWASEL